MDCIIPWWLVAALEHVWLYSEVQQEEALASPSLDGCEPCCWGWGWCGCWPGPTRTGLASGPKNTDTESTLARRRSVVAAQDSGSSGAQRSLQIEPGPEGGICWCWWAATASRCCWGVGVDARLTSCHTGAHSGQAGSWGEAGGPRG